MLDKVSEKILTSHFFSLTLQMITKIQLITKKIYTIITMKQNVKSTRTLLLVLAAIMMPLTVIGQNPSANSGTTIKPVKNIILLIPDGCSIATVSTARWYQWCKNPEQEKLFLDPYLCGTVRTTCSNAPIGDSAPTTSTFMTGYNSLAGWVSTYPLSKGKDDIYPMDPNRAYQPLTTMMEAARLTLGKSCGLVCTCYFPHATPADCSAHSYDRSKYELIADQQIHNGINVVIGGGLRYMTPEREKVLQDKGIAVLKNDIEGMRQCTSNDMWALFRSGDTSYDLDRDPAKEPSLAEMTQTAINHLKTNPEGFVLMVEGSKVDYAAHNNDIIGMITEFLAFDKACKVAFDFAKENGETAVIVVPDHGNSGISIGRRDWGGYASTTKDKTFGALMNIKATPGVLAEKLNRASSDKAQSIFKEWWGFEPNEKEMELMKKHKGYKRSPIPDDDRTSTEGPIYSTSDFARFIAQFITTRTGLSFTTNGHTGEDVFLAAYHPDLASKPQGMLTNIELNQYLCQLNGFNHDTLDSLTAVNFAPHTSVFEGLKYEAQDSLLTVKVKKNKLRILPNTNVVELNGKPQEISTVIIYVDKNKTFYLPKSLRKMIEQ